MKRVLMIIGAVLLYAACKKENIVKYTEKSRIYFSLRKDSLYSKFPLSTAGNIQIDYAPQNSVKKRDTLRLSFQTSGVVSTADRAFVLERNTAAGTGKEGSDFEFVDKQFVIPAGKLSTIVRLAVLRSPDMAKQPVSFGFRLKANDNFELGPDRDTTNFSSNSAIMNMTAVKITAKDVVVKPANWDSFLQTYFGVYSEVKYRFIIDVLALTSIPSTTTASRMNTYRTNLRNALTKYNNEHPEKLKDENGIEISF